MSSASQVLAKPHLAATGASLYVSTYASGREGLAQERAQDELAAGDTACFGCAVWEQQMADMAVAWKQDIKEKTELKQELVKAKCLCAAKCQESAARAADADSLTAQLVDVKMKLAVRDEEALAQGEVSKLRLRVAATHVDDISDKLEAAQSRMTSLCSEVAAGKRTIATLTDDNVKLAQELQQALAAIARLAPDEVAAVAPPVARVTSVSNMPQAFQPTASHTPSVSVAVDPLELALMTGEADDAQPADSGLSAQSSAADSNSHLSDEDISHIAQDGIKSDAPHEASSDTSLAVVAQEAEVESKSQPASDQGKPNACNSDGFAEPIKLRWWMKLMPSCMRPQ